MPVPHLDAKDYDGVLSDPVVLGGWLFKSKCIRCHTDYEEERLAGDYDSESSLAKAIENGGCRISWARRKGGPLGRTEIHALAKYMMQWEEDDEEPELPELPPLLVDEPSNPSHKKEKKKDKETAEQDDNALAPELQQLVDNNLIAKGGWLYTNNCYRCHLTYEIGRQGKGFQPEQLYRTIREGKISTQMTPFSRLLGGPFSNKDIKAVAEYILLWEKTQEPLAIAPQLMTPPALDPSDFKPIRLTRFPQVHGDNKAGKTLFITHCATCHGSFGEGYIGPSFLKRKWVTRPDLFIKSVVRKGIPGSLMKSWDQGNGGKLSAKDIEDVVSYVDTLSVKVMQTSLNKESSTEAP